MKIIVSILSIWILIKNLSYAVYEYKVNQNKIGSLSVGILNIACFIFANIVLFIL